MVSTAIGIIMAVTDIKVMHMATVKYPNREQNMKNNQCRPTSLFSSINIHVYTNIIEALNGKDTIKMVNHFHL